MARPTRLVPFLAVLVGAGGLATGCGGSHDGGADGDTGKSHPRLDASTSPAPDGGVMDLAPGDGGADPTDAAPPPDATPVSVCAGGLDLPPLLEDRSVYDEPLEVLRMDLEVTNLAGLAAVD